MIDKLTKFFYAFALAAAAFALATALVLLAWGVGEEPLRILLCAVIGQPYACP